MPLFRSFSTFSNNEYNLCNKIDATFVQQVSDMEIRTRDLLDMSLPHNHKTRAPTQFSFLLI